MTLDSKYEKGEEHKFKLVYLGPKIGYHVHVNEEGLVDHPAIGKVTVEYYKTLLEKANDPWLVHGTTGTILEFLAAHTWNTEYCQLELVTVDTKEFEQ